MGLACSQARLLTLTARKADCEYGISVGSIKKMSLTREQSELSRECQSRLQAKTISYYNKGQYSKMTYNYLMGYGDTIVNGTRPIKSDNSMILTDYNGRVVMSNAYANVLTSVLGDSAIDNDGRGKTFSTSLIPEILGKLLPGYSKEDFEAAINGSGITSSYESNSTVILTDEITGSDVVNNSDMANEILNSVVDFYYPIFQAAAANGWTTEYNNEMKLNDNYVSDALVNGTFQLACTDDNGNYKPDTSLSYFVTAGLINARTDSDVREEVKAWYNAEKARIAEKEDLLDIEIQDLSTELESIKTEMQSIKSLIDDAISSVFDWGSS